MINNAIFLNNQRSKYIDIYIWMFSLFLGLITQELEIQMVIYKNAQWENGEKMFFL